MKQSWLYGCLSLMMMGLAMLHLKHLTPWVDEVMFLDTPMHYVKGMGWTTFAWYSAARQEPFLLYPPLYSMLMALWMKVFGTTLMTCRSLNLVITLSIGWGLLRICRQLGTRPSLPLTVVLVMLLWGTNDMVYMYSNGRPDLLGAAILTFLMSEAIRYAKNGRLGWTLMLISALLLAAAIQAVVCLLLMLLLAYLLLKDHRDTLRRIALLSVSGTLLGLSLVCLFMASHGHLTSFLANAVSYSNTLMTLSMVVLPVLGDFTGTDTTLYLEKIAHCTTEVPLYTRILTAYTHPAYVALLATALFIFLSERNSLKTNPLYGTTRCLFAFVCSMPVLMNVAGRFPSYYYWMVYLPAILLILLLLGLSTSRRPLCLTAPVSLLLAVQGFARPPQQSDYPAIEAFMGRCTMLKGKNVVAPFSVFYELEQLNSHAYYIGVYPPRYLPDAIDYVILPQKDSEYGASRLHDYYDSLNAADSLQTVMVAESEAAGLKVFKVVRIPGS